VDRTYGSTGEIESLYRQHGPALLLFALAITAERGRAQDAVHQVFLNLIEKGGLNNAVDKKAYLFACVRNAALNEGKLQGRTTPLDRDSVSAWFSPPGS
jgi:DNA-directed RNA polymerase specialized sigma24 family protein